HNIFIPLADGHKTKTRYSHSITSHIRRAALWHSILTPYLKLVRALSIPLQSGPRNQPATSFLPQAKTGSTWVTPPWTTFSHRLLKVENETFCLHCKLQPVFAPLSRLVPIPLLSTCCSSMRNH